MATPAAQLDELFSATFPSVKPTLVDQVTKETALLAALDTKSQVKQDGGLTIRRRLLFDLNDTVGSYDGYDLIDITPQDGTGYAEYSWKQYAGSVTIDGKTEKLNSGPSQIANILSEKMEQLRISMEQDINNMLWGDGTGNGGKDMLGIQAIVNNTGVLGGVDSATETWWQSKVVTSAISLATTAGVKALKSILNSLKLAKSTPDFCFTTQANYEAYEDLAVLKVQFTDLKMAELGFDTVALKRSEVVFEDAVPANHWYFINSRNLEFIQHSAEWMELTPFVRPANQNAKTALVLCMGNLITNCRRAHGVATNVS
jgi:hypothetical protein